MIWKKGLCSEVERWHKVVSQNQKVLWKTLAKENYLLSSFAGSEFTGDSCFKTTETNYQAVLKLLTFLEDNIMETGGKAETVFVSITVPCCPWWYPVGIFGTWWSACHAGGSWWTFLPDSSSTYLTHPVGLNHINESTTHSRVTSGSLAFYPQGTACSCSSLFRWKGHL